MQSINKQLEEAHAALRTSFKERKALRSTHASIQAQVCGMGMGYGVVALRYGGHDKIICFGTSTLNCIVGFANVRPRVDSQRVTSVFLVFGQLAFLEGALKASRENMSISC